MDTSEKPSVASADFVFDFPDDSEQYHCMIKPGVSVKMKSGLVTLQPGTSVGTHSTENREEMLIILSGTGELLIENEVCHVLHKDRIAYIPPFTQHNVRNIGIEVLKYIFVVTPTD